MTKNERIIENCLKDTHQVKRAQNTAQKQSWPCTCQSSGFKEDIYKIASQSASFKMKAFLFLKMKNSIVVAAEISITSQLYGNRFSIFKGAKRSEKVSKEV